MDPKSGMAGAGWLASSLLAASLNATAAPADTTVNELGAALYRELATDGGNVFLSPYSIAVALAMTAEGARGETAQQFGALLALPAAQRRDDTQRPWDLAPTHGALAALGARLAPRPPAPELLRQLDALRAELEQANADLRQATRFDQAYYAKNADAEALAERINTLQRDIDPTVFRAANSLFLERSFRLEPPFLATLDDHYRTGAARAVDFRGAPEAARDTINHWVATQTEQRIPELLAPGLVTAQTRLVLVNAVYFLGEWLEPFDRARTRDEPFRRADGATATVPLMRATKREGVRYAAFGADGAPFDTPRQVDARSSDTRGRYPEHGFQLVELPYRGDALAMWVLVPRQPDDLAALEARLGAAEFARWETALQERPVDVALPRFALNTGAELSAMLQKLGLRRAFADPAGPDGAQFDGMSASADPAQRLYIGAVVHQAMLQVDEKGTEAAAATAVSMLAGAALPTMIDFTPQVRADQPFLFLIRERRSGATLFLGRLARPD